jgi:Dihydrofolate reductase
MIEELTNISSRNSPGVHYVPQFEAALETANFLAQSALNMDRLVATEDVSRLLVIGGAQIYQEAIQHSQCRGLFLTRVIDHPSLSFDTYFPSIDTTLFPQAINITAHVLTALIQWPGTGPRTKEALQLHLQSHSNNPLTFTEQGYTYSFFYYPRTTGP